MERLRYERQVARRKAHKELEKDKEHGDGEGYEGDPSLFRVLRHGFSRHHSQVLAPIVLSGRGNGLCVRRSCALPVHSNTSKKREASESSASVTRERKKTYLTLMAGNGTSQAEPQLQSTVEQEWEKAVRQHPEYRDALKKAWHLLVVCRKPENQWITDCIFQERDNRPLRYIDVLFYSELIFQLIRGHLYYIGIEVKRPPVTNPDEGILDEITLAAVEAPFAADFGRRTAGGSPRSGGTSR